MKAIFTLIFVFAFSVMLSSQTISHHPVLQSTDSYAPINDIDLPDPSFDNESYPDTFYVMDFSGGFGDGSWLPAGWSNNGVSISTAKWEYRGPSVTPDHNVGSRGACMNAATVLNSPTRTNGFFIFDSNYLDDIGAVCAGSQGSGVAPSPHEGHLVSEVIDLSGHPYVMLVFNYYIRDFQGEQRVEITTNGGVSWIPVWEANLEVNQASPLNAVAEINLTPYGAGNVSNFQFRFAYDGDYYAWMVDDIMLVEPNANELVNVEGSYYFNDYWYQYITTVDSANSKPAQLPLTQMPGFGNDINFFSRVRNNGTLTQTSVVNNVQVTRNGSPVHSSSSNPVSIPANGDTTFILHSANFMPAQTGFYRMSFLVDQAETDFNVANNLRTDSLIVTDTVMARDFITAASHVLGGVNDNRADGDNNGADYFKLANYFEVPVADTVTSISFWIVGSQSEAGKVIGVNVLDRTRQGAFPSLPDGVEYTLTASDVSSTKLITIPLNDVPLDERILTDSFYFACVYLVDNDPYTPANTSGRDLSIGYGSPYYKYASFIYLPMSVSSNKWFYLGTRTIGIRMNFGIVPAIGVEENEIDFNLAAFPNPASSHTMISFTLPSEADVEMFLHDAAGKVVRASNLKGIAGVNTVMYTTSDLASGAYYYVIRSGGYQATGKLIIAD